MDLDRWGVLTTLALYADADGLCYPSQATIARVLKRSRPWVNRVIADLADAGLIRKTARTRTGNGGTTSCEYRLVMDPNERLETHPGVTGGTPGCHADDTPRHPADRTQYKLKHNNLARPTMRDPSEITAVSDKTNMAREPVPADWTPSANAMERARTLSPDEDLSTHAAMFASRSRAKNYLYATDRIDDAWLAWLAEDRLKHHRKARPDAPAIRAVGLGSSGDPGAKRYAAWAAAASVPKLRTVMPPPGRQEAENPWK
jgi:hypothetical protein